MKHKIAFSFILLLLLAVCGLSASAIDEITPVSDHAYDGIARELYGIHILQGDGTDFNLDQVPDRMQACVMVVRMRGEEAEALAAYEAGEISCPFTDVTDAQAWAKPYLAWLYDKKITLGTGDGKFGNGICTAQMYAAFMLRALGYRDTGNETALLDFTFADALSYAKEKNIWDNNLERERFDRGVMAAVTYQTLAAPYKNTSGDTAGEGQTSASNSLLETLVLSGAVKAEDARPILDKMNAVHAVSAVLGKMKTGTGIPDAAQTTAVMEMEIISVSQTGAVSTETVVVNTETKVLNDLSAAAMTGNVISDGKSWGKIGTWYKDGTLYTSVYGENKKHSGAAPDDAVTFSLTRIGIPAYYALDSYQDTASVSYTRTEDGGLSVTYRMTDWLSPLMRNMFDMEENNRALFDGVQPTETYDMEMTVLYSAEGMVTAMRFSGILLSVWDFEANGRYTQQYTISAEMTLTAVGNDVVISYPDFSGFAE